ncbi:MAG: hypothetical protein ACYC7F_13595 [Gemmatimonadaceae bacterium]
MPPFPPRRAVMDRTLLVIMLSLFATACGLPADFFAAVPVAVLHVEMLVDRSGSYPALATALASACRIAAQLQPGDGMRARFITERSYGSNAVFLRVNLPPVSEPGGIVSPERKLQRDSVDSAIAAQRRHACDELPVASKVRRASGTDVVGALAAAAGALRAAPSGARRVLVVASDLEDNIDGGKVRIDLSGVRVRFVAIESSHGRVEDVQRSVDRWTAKLLAMGASEVTLVPPGELLDLSVLRKTSPDTTRR